jgi:uncharacterized OB-fold protein
MSDDFIVPQRPLPDLDDDSRPFWEAAARGELVVQACADCGLRRFPPRPMCAECHSLATTWQPLAGEGTVWSYVVAHPPLLPAFMPDAPYLVAIVEMTDAPGIRIAGNLVAQDGATINSVDPATVTVGMPVRVGWAAPSDGVVLPQWVPVA